MLTDETIARLRETGKVLTPAEAAELAAAVGAEVELATLERSGHGEAVLLWRTDHSEAWFNTWWEARDTGFHDHDGSCVGVHVIAGRAANEALTVEGERQIRWYGEGETFSFDERGIHRMDHAAGAVTVHVYSPPIRRIGHYELVDGELCRWSQSGDEESPPSPVLELALAGR
jgi:hypothetical protein